jgi:hypothetical protein
MTISNIQRMEAATVVIGAAAARKIQINDVMKVRT